MNPTTRAGKSSSQLIAIVRQHHDALLPDEYVPIALVPEAHRVRGAKKWFDSGRPENIEYEGWL